MRITARSISGVGVVSVAAILAITVGLRGVHAQAEHVRWDIISLDFATTPFTATEGGVAFAFARNPPNTLKIKFTGRGTFVAPGSGGRSNAVTGGGTWETFSGEFTDSRQYHRRDRR